MDNKLNILNSIGNTKAETKTQGYIKIDMECWTCILNIGEQTYA